MNLRHHLLLLAAILLPSSTSATTLNLFQVQQISNFPAECTAAYNSDVPGCTRSEISVTGNITSAGEGICSSQCISALTFIDSSLSRACTGVRASSNTLIGLFFDGQGISYLCPNSVPGIGPSPSPTGEEDTSTVTSTSTSISTSTSTSTTSPLTPPSQTPEPSSPSSPTTAPPPNPSFQVTTAADKGVATVLTSEAERSGSPNPDAFGGGGSPFEISANGASGLGRRGFSNAVATMSFLALFWGILVVVGMLDHGWGWGMNR